MVSEIEKKTKMTETRSLKQRDATFDIMKGIGILLVITAHFFSWNHPLLGRFITSFHMPMFFAVAGYFSKSFISWTEVWMSIKKYASRLLPAFIFTQVLLALWAVLMAVTKGEGWDPVIREGLSLFWADPHGAETPWGRLSIGVVWFLVALFVSKTILLVLSKWKAWAVLVSILLAIGALLLHKVFPYSIWCISIGFTALPFVTIGWWFRTHKVPVWFILVCLICWILAVIYSHLDMYDMNWGCYPLDFLGALGGTFCLFFLSRCISRYIAFLAKPFATLGIWSLAIMCFHNLEMSCHLGNHVMALLPFPIPIWGRFVFRYMLTIALAAAAVYAPGLKKIFT